MARYKCDICGAETNNGFERSFDRALFSVCDKCLNLKSEELVKLDNSKLFSILMYKTLEKAYKDK